MTKPLMRPDFYQQFLYQYDLIDDVYKAMRSSDLSEVVVTVLEALRTTNSVPLYVEVVKSQEKSILLRNEGNEAYSRGNHEKALESYNKALLFAPKDSQAMKLAYGNRSALLYNMKAFAACVKDIEICFDLGCPIDIIDKLNRRKEKALNLLPTEIRGSTYTCFSRVYFNFNVKRNPQIPSASTDVGVIVESDMPKIVAVTNIKVGTVLAVEKAYVSYTENKMYLTCYNCQKMVLNLIPCDNCCFALFCNEDCKERCMKEYHSVECHIRDLMETFSDSKIILAVKAVLKLKLACESWEEFITSSQILGIDRIKSNSINEIYDANNKLSLLNFKDDKHFIYGTIYNVSFACATIIHYLDTITSFLPQLPNERQLAIRSIARIMMFSSIFPTNTQIVLPTKLCTGRNELNGVINYGYFSFIGKLKNSCNPNVMAVGLNRQMALVALQPLKRGTELTVSYLGHWLDYKRELRTRVRNIYVMSGYICKCPICSGEWQSIDCELTEDQQELLRGLNIWEIKERFNTKQVPYAFPKLCQALAVLGDVQYSKEYAEVYKLFRKCILYSQEAAAGNETLWYFK